MQPTHPVRRASPRTRSAPSPARRAASAVAAVLLAAGSAHAQNYTSGGYETTSGFVPDFALPGQTGGTPLKTWLPRGGTTLAQITVREEIGIAGTQGVRLEYGTDTDDGISGNPVRTDNRATVPNLVDTADRPFVSVSWQMSVQEAEFDPATELDPLFVIEALDDGGDGSSNTVVPLQVAGLGIASGSGGIVYLESEPPPGDPAGYFFIGDDSTPDDDTDILTVPFGEYVAFRMDLDYVSGVYDIFVDDLVTPLLSGIPFFNEGVGFTNAELAGFGGSGTATALADYDDYVITAVPEPGSVGLLVAATVGLGLRRRR